MGPYTPYPLPIAPYICPCIGTPYDCFWEGSYPMP